MPLATPFGSIFVFVLGHESSLKPASVKRSSTFMLRTFAFACILTVSFCVPLAGAAPEPVPTAEAALVAARHDYTERVAALMHPDHRRLLERTFERTISLQVGLVLPPDAPIRAFDGFSRPEVAVADSLFVPAFGRAEAVRATRSPVWVLTFSTLSSAFDVYLDGVTQTILYIRFHTEG